MKSFSEINVYTKEKLAHSSRYTEKEFSFLKIYQHALRFTLFGQQQKLIRNYFQFPYLVQVLIYWLKSKSRNPKRIQPKLKEYVIIDPGRAVLGDDKTWHSIYFDSLTDLIGKERLSIISVAAETSVPHDFMTSSLNGKLPPLSKTEKKLLREMNASVRKAVKGKQFTSLELSHIRSEMHLFFESFRQYYHLFKNQSIKHVVFVCHYQREGLIAAMKILGIKNTEMQHGLIASNDLYYVYDEQFSEVMVKALISDRILVYGPYWKRVLENGCEFKSRDIYIGGDYLYRLKTLDVNKPKKENLILICTQTGMTEDYILYVKILLEHLKKNPEWQIIIKLHPSQVDKTIYDEFIPYGVDIIDKQIPLDVLLSRAKIQITIYSTTIYDALGFDVINFSLQDFGVMSDYANDMIEEGAAIPLHSNEDPIEKYFKIKETPTNQFQILQREEVYAPYNPDIFKELLELT